MFVEPQSGSEGRLARRLEDVARRHPRAFTALLVLLTVSVTLALLLNLASPIVLYQGF